MSRISEKMNDLLNAEIGLEYYAHLQYLAMGAYFEKLGLDGLASFFFRQADEEQTHSRKLFKYVVEVGGKVHFPPIDSPQTEFSSAEELAQLFVDQEAHVTQRFYEMVALAEEESDFITRSFLQWFVDEQREEMATSEKLLDLIRLSGQDQLLMVEMMIDKIEAAAAALEAGSQ